MNIDKLKLLKKLTGGHEFLLCTDMYQLTMNAVYMAENRHNEEVVFECFVRSVREKVNPDKDVYYFSGEKEIHTMMNKIKEIFENKEYVERLREDFKKLVMAKIDNNKKKDVETAINKAFKEKPAIEYHVIKEGTPVIPLVPVFIFKGSRWIGQIIETMITNIVNGKTGYNTLKKMNQLDKKTDEYMRNLTLGIFDEELPDIEIMNDYKKHLEQRADEYKRELKNGQKILDASFRRAPGFYSAFMSTETAMQKEWHGTSNTTLYFIEGEKALEKIGGSFAHSFVMGHKTEKEAYETWLKYYPNSILLIDTYDVMNAVKMIIENGLKTSFVRIDSDPLDDYALKAEEEFKKAGVYTKIYLSSDITPEILRDYNKRNIPCARLMAGTKYVNCGDVENINCGFVYKITVNSIDGEMNFPEKKSTGKINYSGYKYVVFGKDKTMMTYDMSKGNQREYGYKYEVDVKEIAKKVLIVHKN
ncbi:MAG: Nicotinate phosphoribosyltransferase pncB2 [candidate division CPR1 bacterium ADurb.Bin160]|uniref:nicotinate phosphoribosyltransferase n=1 Tax=candidate division CPR1 bacterium ADurb.Bin160 TaxID=1852826 RepID=A0A1V5ZIL5_9BACT|nr:MAG: Nicotinate phosphoribosyltransferase pncB2 [candidate division CPR1 bacterium ADurb.Bin160]